MTARKLYTPAQLAARDVEALNAIFDFAAMDVDLDGVHYQGMSREKTIAAAQQTQADVIAELHARAIAEDVARTAGELP